MFALSYICYAWHGYYGVELTAGNATTNATANATATATAIATAIATATKLAPMYIIDLIRIAS